jgi:superfamily II DNA or RNA helicase
MAERRRFNDRERAALYLAADGRCSECGAELVPGWHADHVEPWSRGGPTDVVNGQALCPPCNLAKGATSMELRRWQNEALARFLGHADDFLTVATPGAGKTTFAVVAAQRLIELGEVGRLVVVVPTTHLRSQWATAAARLGVQLDHRFANGTGVIAKDYDGTVVTYSTVAAAPLLWRKLVTDQPTLVVIDEVHHAGDELSWGAALREAFAPAARRLLLSGTPFRSDGASIPFVHYDEERRCIATGQYGYTYDYGEALQDRSVVRPVEFAALDGEVRWREAGKVVATHLADADDETLANALVSALNPDGDWIRSVLRRADEELNRHRTEVPDAGGLVVAPDQYRARRYAVMLERISGGPVTLAISDEPDASELIAAFARGSSKWIVAVQMVSEGVDIPRLAVGVYASRIRTDMFFRQVTGRLVRMRGEEDETYATLFIPSIQPLLEYAREIEETRNRALKEQEQQVRQRVKDYEQGTLHLDLVEPLDSSEAVHHSTILAGDTYSDDELRRALAAGQAANMPASVAPVQIARLMRLLGAGRVVGTATVSAPSAPRPLADEKAAIRRLIKSKVGRLFRVADMPYAHIHAQLNRACGDTAQTATMDSLNRRLDLLDRWLEEA